MSKIDLLDQKWIDLVFEGKNEAYGAYTVRTPADVTFMPCWHWLAVLPLSLSHSLVLT